MIFSFSSQKQKKLKKDNKNFHKLNCNKHQTKKDDNDYYFQIIVETFKILLLFFIIKNYSNPKYQKKRNLKTLKNDISHQKCANFDYSISKKSITFSNFQNKKKVEKIDII